MLEFKRRGCILRDDDLTQGARPDLVGTHALWVGMALSWMLGGSKVLVLHEGCPSPTSKDGLMEC